MKIVKKDGKYEWVEDTSVTSKISKYTKLNRFITNKYNNILNKTQNYYFKNNNKIFETKKFNSMLGFCVEYTTKYRLNPESLPCKFIPFLKMKDIKKNMKIWKNNEAKAVFVRFAIEEYQRIMKLTYNMPAKNIPSMSLEKLINEHTFINTIADYSLKTARFFVDYFSLSKDNFREKYINNIKKCNLSVSHISGLADFIIDDTIIDLKCTSEINEKYIKQVLTYYWLSKKHKLNIKNVMIYEAITDRWIKINMKTEEITSNY